MEMQADGKTEIDMECCSEKEEFIKLLEHIAALYRVEWRKKNRVADPN